MQYRFLPTLKSNMASLSLHSEKEKILFGVVIVIVISSAIHCTHAIDAQTVTICGLDAIKARVEHAQELKRDRKIAWQHTHMHK